MHILNLYQTVKKMRLIASQLYNSKNYLEKVLLTKQRLTEFTKRKHKQQIELFKRDISYDNSLICRLLLMDLLGFSCVIKFGDTIQLSVFIVAVFICCGLIKFGDAIQLFPPLYNKNIVSSSFETRGLLGLAFAMRFYTIYILPTHQYNNQPIF